MKKHVILVSFLSVFLIFCSCENEPYEGPLNFPESNEDNEIPDDFQNTFSAKLNGEEFVDNQIYTLLSVDSQDNDFLAITGSENNYHSIILYLPYEIDAGTYYFDPETIVNVPNLNVTYSNLADLLTSGIGNGSITIDEHDILNRYIKGTFECAVNSDDGTVQYITEGRFDIVY